MMTILIVRVPNEVLISLEKDSLTLIKVECVSMKKRYKEVVIKNGDELA